LKIAILGSRGYPFVYSGYETFVSELSVRLVQRGHEVYVYCHKGLFLERPKQVNGVRLVYIPAIETKVMSQITHSLLASIHAIFRKYDVLLFVNSANGPFGAITHLGGVPSAINVDGLEWLRPKWKGLGAKYFRFASFLATKLFDRVVTDSTEMAKIYDDVFGSPSVTIAYGANLSWSSAPGLLETYGLRPGEYYLIVGRMVPDNNAELIVKGFLKSSIAKKLVVVGDVPYKDAYASRVRALADSRVVFTGYVRDAAMLRELFCNSYVYVHGHEFGGTNPSLLTGLACGCCVAALDTRFSREVLAGDKHGTYFGKDPLDIAETLTKLDNDPVAVQSMKEVARGRISSEYTWEKITDEYIALFKSLRA
jgi:glycosyltransferase involved in cell wall biosynthesis